MLLFIVTDIIKKIVFTFVQFQLFELLFSEIKYHRDLLVKELNLILIL